MILLDDNFASIFDVAVEGWTRGHRNDAGVVSYERPFGPLDRATIRSEAAQIERVTPRFLRQSRVDASEAQLETAATRRHRGGADFRQPQEVDLLHFDVEHPRD